MARPVREGDDTEEDRTLRFGQRGALQGEPAHRIEVHEDVDERRRIAKDRRGLLAIDELGPEVLGER